MLHYCGPSERLNNSALLLDKKWTVQDYLLGMVQFEGQYEVFMVNCEQHLFIDGKWHVNGGETLNRVSCLVLGKARFKLDFLILPTCICTIIILSKLYFLLVWPFVRFVLTCHSCLFVVLRMSLSCRRYGLGLSSSLNGVSTYLLCKQSCKGLGTGFKRSLYQLPMRRTIEDYGWPSWFPL